MKILLIIGSVVCCVYGAEPFVHYCDSEDGTWNETTHKINDYRIESASANKTANMHKLKYDLDLEKVIKGFKSCDDFKHGSNYRVYPENISELYRPRQTSFASCMVQRPSECRNTYIIYIFGPQGKNDAEGLEKGEPGSKCGEKGKTEDGLCNGPEIANEKTSHNEKLVYGCASDDRWIDESSAEFVEDANNRRSMRAKKHQIANMNRLNYDLELEKFARGLTSCDDLMGGNNHRIEKYYKAKENEALVDAFFKRTNTSEFDAESYHPLQASMAVCHVSVDKKCAGTWKIYGPIKQFDLSYFAKGEPGSACQHGKTDNGLCIVPEKPTSAPEVSDDSKSSQGNSSSKENSQGGGDSSNPEESNHGNVQFNLIPSLFTVIFVIFLV